MSKRVLYLNPYDNIFSRQQNGGGQCARRNYDFLCSVYGIDSVFACLFLKDINVLVPPNVKIFPRPTSMIGSVMACLQGTAIYEKKLIPLIKKYVDEVNPDIVFLEHSHLTTLLPLLPNKVKTILFVQNMEGNYWKNKVTHGKPYLYPVYKVMQKNEKEAIKVADVIICLNERDGKLLKDIYRREPDYLLPISFSDIFEENRMEVKEPIKKELLFVGSCFGPNLDGITWFIREIMPLLPGYTLTIVGKDFETKHKELSSEHVQVVGSVDDLSEYYYGYLAQVIPIRYGDGMKVKTAEAMMFGRTIFATDEALEGYTVDGVQGIFRCNTAQEFADAIRKFFEQESVPNFQPDVRQAFLDQYESKKMQKRFAEFLRSRGLV